MHEHCADTTCRLALLWVALCLAGWQLAVLQTRVVPAPAATLPAAASPGGGYVGQSARAWPYRCEYKSDGTPDLYDCSGCHRHTRTENSLPPATRSD